MAPDSFTRECLGPVTHFAICPTCSADLSHVQQYIQQISHFADGLQTVGLPVEQHGLSGGFFLAPAVLFCPESKSTHLK